MAMAMVLLGVLMVSHVPYAKVPRIGLRTRKGQLTTVWILTLLILAVTLPRYYFFTALVVYIVWGLLKSVLLGLLERLPDRDPLLDEDDEEPFPPGDVRSLDYSELNPAPRPRRPSENES
jgi:CDP-diacylglycerol--serine O-phosphatidyltransferase